ncbi:hypothetical protein FRC10_004220 [Ceratobasidium sp. 414]|nr:hypothetical protein FRC10_004220 [Ceratobasidium sp. 414]
MVVVVFTFASYGLTTALPLFKAFCPYTTPISSRFLAGCLYRRIFTNSKDNNPVLPCQRKEKEICERSIPDHVTGRALDWLIKHSEDEAMVDVAIRAIAGAELPKDVWDLLAENSLIVLVAQKFTALFGGVLDQETDMLEPPRDARNTAATKDKGANGTEKQPETEKQLEMMSLYGRALTNIVKHKHPIDTEVGVGVKADSEPLPGDVLEISLTPDQTQAVTRGLHLLASCESPNIAAFGITSISAWYMFTMQPRNQWKDTLVKSFKIILAHVKGKEQVCADALAGLMHTLPIEISYWEQGMSRAEKREVLLPLVELLKQDSWVEQVQEGLPLMLAVLAISVNDYPDLYTLDEFQQWERTYEDYSNLVATHLEAAKKWQHDPPHYHSNPPTHHDAANRAGWRMWRAQQAAAMYTLHPNLRKNHNEALLLIGLAGLLDSLGPLCLEDKSADIATAAARQLGRMSILNESRSISFPLVLPLAFDLRAYAVDRVVQALRPSRYGDDIGMFGDKAKVSLLKAFSEKPRLWMDFGAQLALPVVELLHTTTHTELQRQCLISLEEHSLTNPSPRKWELLSAYAIPDTLVRIISHSDPDLRSRAISSFESFSRHLGDSGGIGVSRADILRSILLNDLFGIMVEKVVCRPGAKHMVGWKAAILELVDLLKKNSPTNRDDATCLKRLAGFCEKPTTDDFVTSLQKKLKSEPDLGQV